MIISTAIFPLMLIALAFIFLKSIKYEKQINKLYREKEEKIEKERKRPISKGFFEGFVKNIEKEYQYKIKELERKRRFLLDKIPFLKK